MSSNYTRTMLMTLKQYENCEITITITDDHHHSILAVCYLNKCYQITYVNTFINKTYKDIESTLSAIDKAIQDWEQIS